MPPTRGPAAIRPYAATALLICATGCATARLGALAAPQGPSALGLEFGKDRAATQAALAAAGIAARPDPADADALLADRCERAPAGRCRLLFGPEGLYAAQVEVPAADERALVATVEAALGAPARRESAAAPEGLAPVVAAWERPGWALGITRHASASEPPTAVLQIEYERAAPPAVLGVPLGRWRADVENLLEQGGAVQQSRGQDETTYLGCPHGSPEALTCVVHFAGDRAAAVTEVYPPRGGDEAALGAWRDLAARFEAEIGRAPVTTCPPSGPDRVGGDCTATWAGDKLTVVVGAHRGAGSRHRGAISVYTGFSYPPLAPANVTGAEDASP